MNLKHKVTSLANIRGAMVFEFFSPGIPIILKHSGCEFIIFDMEHGGLSLQQFKTLANISSANNIYPCLLYTSPSPRDGLLSRMPSSA